MISAVMTKGEPDAVKRSCFDCAHCKVSLTWWCMNKEAVKYRGTSIPGVIHCPYWSPVRKYSELTFWEKVFGDFVKIEQTAN